MIKRLKSKFDIHTFEVLVNSSKTILVKIVGMVASIIISLFLAKKLGPDGLGIVNFANKLGTILLIFTMFGFQNVIVKFISIGKNKQADTTIKTVLKTSLIFNGILSIIIVGLAVLILPLVLNIWAQNQNLYIPLLIAFIMVIPQTISRVYGAALNGYGKIREANLVNKNLTPILVSLGLLIYYLLNITCTPISILLLYAVCRVLLFFLVLFIWKRTFKTQVKGQFDLKPMFKMALPLLLTSGTVVIASNIDVLMLGAIGTFKDVGFYSVAARLALLTSLFLQVSNSAIKPKIAVLFNDSKFTELELMVKRITRILFFVAIMFLLLFILFGKSILSFWGPEFQEAYVVLLILAVGQFFNMATGCSGMLLVMCGHEKILGYISLTTVILNIILNVILIINYGVLGAAIATAITVMFTNLIKLIIVKQKLGISVLPI